MINTKSKHIFNRIYKKKSDRFALVIKFMTQNHWVIYIVFSK